MRNSSYPANQLGHVTGNRPPTGSRFLFRFVHRFPARAALLVLAALLLAALAGPVGADWQDEFIVPIVLEENRTPPNVVEPPQRTRAATGSDGGRTAQRAP